MKRVIKQKMEDGSLQVVSQSITVPIAEWQALKKQVEEGTLYNTEEIITESGTWTALVTGWHEIVVVGGGSGAYASTDSVNSGNSGFLVRRLIYLEKSANIPVTIGSGGVATDKNNILGYNSTALLATHGNSTTFGNITAMGGYQTGQPGFVTQAVGHSVSGLAGLTNCNEQPKGGNPLFPGNYGKGGDAAFVKTSGVINISSSFFNNGIQGAVVIRSYDPTKP